MDTCQIFCNTSVGTPALSWWPPKLRILLKTVFFACFEHLSAVHERLERSRVDEPASPRWSRCAHKSIYEPKSIRSHPTTLDPEMSWFTVWLGFDKSHFPPSTTYASPPPPTHHQKFSLISDVRSNHQIGVFISGEVFMMLWPPWYRRDHLSNAVPLWELHKPPCISWSDVSQNLDRRFTKSGRFEIHEIWELTFSTFVFSFKNVFSANKTLSLAIMKRFRASIKLR